MIAGVHMVRRVRKGKPPMWHVYAYRGGPSVFRQEGDPRPRLGSSQLRAISDAIDKARQPDETNFRALI